MGGRRLNPVIQAAAIVTAPGIMGGTIGGGALFLDQRRLVVS
jgi:hypothetical protein